MAEPNEPPSPPEYNITGIDYAERGHFRYVGPIIDAHSHVMQTRPNDPKDGPPATGPGASADQAATMLEVAAEFGVGRIFTMCPVDDIPILRERFANRLTYIGMINKKIDEPEEVAYRMLDRYLENGVALLKFWSAPRGRERGLVVDAPWRIEAARRAQAAGIKIIMVHVADPDAWFRKAYADSAKFGTKPEQYVPFERMMDVFPGINWIAAHMGGDPEHPDHLEALLDRHPNLYFDTSAAKWQIREVSIRREAVRSLITRKSDRFLFGSDLVTRHWLKRDHYVSRYWCHRTLWESSWEGPSPIADPDFEGPNTPSLKGLALSLEVLQQVYWGNAMRLFGI